MYGFGSKAKSSDYTNPDNGTLRVSSLKEFSALPFFAKFIESFDPFDKAPWVQAQDEGWEKIRELVD